MKLRCNFSEMNAKMLKCLRGNLGYDNIHWHPPHRGWIKCNINCIARWVPSLSSCGGIFRNESADYFWSFANFLGGGNVFYAELVATMTIVELDRDKRLNSLWIEIRFPYYSKCFHKCGECFHKCQVSVIINVKLVPWRIRPRGLNYVALSYAMRFTGFRIYRECNGCDDSLATIGFISRSHNRYHLLRSYTHKDFFVRQIWYPKA